MLLSCHYDIIEWLQPDWMYDMNESRFYNRDCLRQRPPLDLQVYRVSGRVFPRLFKPHYYLDLPAPVIAGGIPHFITLDTGILDKKGEIEEQYPVSMLSPTGIDISHRSVAKQSRLFSIYCQGKGQFFLQSIRRIGILFSQSTAVYSAQIQMRWLCILYAFCCFYEGSHYLCSPESV